MMNNIFQMINQIKANPMSVLGRYGVPKDIANNPQAVIQHLLNTGRISQAQYDMAVSKAHSMGMK